MNEGKWTLDSKTSLYGLRQAYLLVVLDLEHTGWSTYRSDIIQLAAKGFIYDPNSTENLISDCKFSFLHDCKTFQKMSPNLPQHFHRMFPPTRTNILSIVCVVVYAYMLIMFFSSFQVYELLQILNLLLNHFRPS